MREQRNGQVIRMMTYNIHRWAGRDRRMDLDGLAEIIRDARADIVGLNEVLHPVTVGGRTCRWLAELAERLEMGYAFGASGWIDCGPGWTGPVGNALLSRYPMQDLSNTLLPRAPGTKQRSLLGATLAEGPARGLSAYVTHLDHAFEGTRLLQLGGILSRLVQHKPHFLAGDFNTPGFLGRRTARFLPPVLRYMRRAGYQDAFWAVGVGSGHTFPAHAPLWRIDFLFFPHPWAKGLRSAHTLDMRSTLRVSDHRPVLVEWSWPAPA